MAKLEDSVKTQPQKCLFCKYEVDNFNRYVDHMYISHNENKYFCYLCDATFTTGALLQLNTFRKSSYTALLICPNSDGVRIPRAVVPSLEGTFS